MIATISEQDFEREVLTSERPVLVFFFAVGYSPCEMVAPEVEAVAAELEGKAKVVKMDVDKAPRLAAALRLQGVPTFAVFHQGRPVGMKGGVLRKKDLRGMVEPFLPRAEGAVKPAELAELIKQGQVVPVDVREANAFGRAHIPGATNMPSAEIRTRLAELNMLGGEPVLYCRTGAESKELSDELAQGGFAVGFLEGGFLGWEGELLPVERP